MDPKFNTHADDYHQDVTGIEFNIKNPPGELRLTEDQSDYEQTTASFLIDRAHKLTDRLMKKYKWITGWTMVGRSEGYFVLLTHKEPNEIRATSLAKLTEEVEHSYKTFVEDLNKYYGA